MGENKLYIRVNPEFDQEFTSWANRLGLTKSQFGAICVTSGLYHIIQAVSPVEAITPEQLVAIVQAAQSKGVELDLSEFERKGGVKK